MEKHDSETIESLDPRITRAAINYDGISPLENLDQFQTYEVFHQLKRGAQHVHVGIVHAPNPEMALLYAKEQYARRGQTTNIWVVPSVSVFATSYHDSDIFETTPEKIHRDPGTYKVMDRIQAFKERQKS
ncbi:MAG: 1,2-phenylacetyl-CoA epoxidase subunit B [Bacteroidia bacterium]